jgi:hypothetical protein
MSLPEMKAIHDGSTVTVSEMNVTTLAVEVSTAALDKTEPVTTVLEAVDMLLTAVRVENVLETDIVMVPTGLTVKRPILLAESACSVK